MRKLYSLLIVPAFLIGAPVSADDAKSDPARDENGKVVDKKHPDFIRCKTEPIIGSRARKRRVCLTNRQWAEVESQGKGIARGMVEDSSTGILTN